MAYDPKTVEREIRGRWERSGLYNPDNLPGRRAKAFSIAMPPPNVTGDLHIGHALTITLEDLMTRYHRMRGKATLWVPGTDHAGIATQIMVERMLAEQGATRHDLGRERFLEHVWAWKKKHGSRIIEQIKAMGASCDWGREHFTMDRDLTAAVQAAFVRLFDDGLVYRANRLISWCPNDRTALSDLEVSHEERAGTLWYIRYPVIGTQHAVVVATTRPETLLGDTAVAVHPKDERYRALVGRRIRLPLTGREIPIVTDYRVERDFGTGAVKVTPAHDFADAAIADAHHLPAITVISPEATMTRAAGADFEGLPVHEARVLVVEALKREGLLEREEDYRHSVAVCGRCGATIEPQLSKQWFIKMTPLAKRALAAVRSKKIVILPHRFAKQYAHWMENIQDWCVSRQLWWGHPIPIWYCAHCETPVASATRPAKACATCHRRRYRHDDDVLDTWFSSALWTFSTLGWPKKTRDLQRFHPTSVMETGWDILTFWVSRMVMLSLYLVGQVPFKTVYLNGLILDKNGKKMSKSKGTGIDPLLMTDRYGTDAVRLALTIGQSAGQDFRMYEEKIAGQRNFVNKLWNIGQYVLRAAGGGGRGRRASASGPAPHTPHPQTLADKWIVSRLAVTTREVTAAIDRFDFSAAGQRLIDFTWHDFADWYLEVHKVEKNDAVLRSVFEAVLVLLHPFAPFVTEALWKSFGGAKRGLLMIRAWPKAHAPQPRAERAFMRLQTMVGGLRIFALKAGGPENGAADVPAAERPLIERLSGLSLSSPRNGLMPLTIGGLRCWFPPERVGRFRAWREARRAELSRYTAALTAKLANPKLPAPIRSEVNEKLLSAHRELDQLRDA